MSTTTPTSGPLSDAYASQSDPEFVSEAAASPSRPSKKAGSPVVKVIMLVLALALVAGVGFVVWNTFLKAKPVATQTARPSAKPKPPVKPAAVEPAPVVEAPASSDLTVPGVVADPGALPASAMDPSAAPGAPQFQSATPTDPTLAAAPTPSATPSPADLSAMMGPAPTVPAVTAPVAAPAVTPTAPVASAALAGSMDDARRDIMAGLDRIETKMTTLSGQFNDLDRRVSALERTGPRSPLQTASEPSQASPRVVRAKPRPVAPRPAPRRIELLSEPSIVMLQKPSAPAEEAPKAEAPTGELAGCKIQAIQPGRVWIQKRDGSFATFGVDDRLPSGGRVSAVDPMGGVSVDGKAWSCR